MADNAVAVADALPRADEPADVEGADDNQPAARDFPLALAAGGDLRDHAPTVPEGFRLTEDGVEKFFPARDGDGEWHRMCSPVVIMAHCRDFSSTGWTLLVEVTDFAGNRHSVPIPRAMLGDGAALRDRLSHYGLQIRPTPAAKAALAEYLSMAKPTRMVRFVTRIGWHGRAFVLPDQTFGTDGDEEVLLEGGNAGHSFKVSGTLADWQEHVARYAVGNSRLILAICAAMVGPLLNLVQGESGGVHFYGPSAVGKSTLLIVSGSFWGGGGVRGFIQSWRTTDNAPEGKARAHCDTAMMLDEMGEVDARVLQASVYMLANSTGKARATRSGETRTAAEWRLFFASTGEIRAEAKMAEGGGRVMVGQQVRLLDCSAVPENGFGIFEELHGFASGAAMSKHLKEAATRYHGTASRAYLEQVVAASEVLPDLLRGCVHNFVDAHCPAGADGQVIRVAERFGLLAAAGELGAGMGILPWPEGEAMAGVSKIFKVWLTTRGGHQAGELLMAVQQVKEHLERHAAKHFDNWLRGVPGGSYIEAKALDRWDFRAKVNGQSEFWASPSGFANLCAGYDSRAVAKELIRLGILKPGTDGKSSVLVTIPGEGKARYYHLVPGGAVDEPAEAADGE